MNKINLNQLYYFYVTASEGSVTKAAKVLHITQPSVSAQIKALEEEVGLELFERKYRRLELTVPGLRFFRKCERIFRLTEDLINEVQTDASGRELFRLGVTPSVSPKMIHKFLHPLFKSKNYIVETICDTTDQLFKLMDEDAVDVIISPASDRMKRRYISRNLGDQALSIIGPAGSQKPSANFPQMLYKQTYIGLNRQHGIQEDINFFLQQKGAQISPSILIGQISSAIELVRTGLGFSILPESHVKDMTKNKQIAKWGELPAFKLRYFATSRRASHHAPLCARLVANFLSSSL